MSIEKSFGEFIVLHEKKSMTREFNALKKNIILTSQRTSKILGEQADGDINIAVKKINEGIISLKRVLIKYNLYDI